MVYKDLPYGSAKIKHFLPSLPCQRYLNCCTMVGWHQCNKLYFQKYDKGIKSLFLIHTVSGAGKLVMNEKTYNLCPNSIIIVSPYTPMKYYTDPQVGIWEFYWLDLIGERLLSVAEKLSADGYCFLNDFMPLNSIYTGLLQESLSESERSVLLEQVLDKIIFKAVFQENKKNAVADQIIQFISEHYKEDISLSRISRQFYFSKNQIIRMVVARSGYTPHEYLTRIRLTKASELLQFTQTPVMEVGMQVGYSNNSHFSAAFRRLYGISPTEYRAFFTK